MTVKCIAMVLGGYVEESLAPILFWTHPDGFPTRFEALSNLANELAQWHVDEHTPRSGILKTKDCCKAVVDPEVRFCPSCGSRVSYGTYALEEERFCSWLDEFYTRPAHEWSGLEDWVNWWPWVDLMEIIQLKPEEILYLPEEASIHIWRAYIINTNQNMWPMNVSGGIPFAMPNEYIVNINLNKPSIYR